VCRLLSTFQSGLEEVTLLATPPQHASLAAGFKALQLQSFLDPEKGVGCGLPSSTAAHSVATLWAMNLLLFRLCIIWVMRYVKMAVLDVKAALGYAIHHPEALFRLTVFAQVFVPAPYSCSRYCLAN
jgi:hypothetical protein